MNFKIIALVAAGLSAAALPTAAEARCNGCAVGAGVVGGLAVGAIIGSAIANGQPRYVEPAPAYAPPQRVYVEEEGPVCHVERQRFWDGYGWRHRRVEVCD
ncbi:MAG: hypothetical protein WCG00_09415 [Hyphomicrobiales bacterium]|jgi:hypothetical protein|nr:hypothetical protein [Hyphomicrobiales bacterium]